jgi:hypothetical protein
VVAVLQSLQLVSCRNVRNRDLFVLANGVHVKAGQQVPALLGEVAAMQVQDEEQEDQAKAVVPEANGVHYDIQLTSLVLGDDTNKPWVTNRCEMPEAGCRFCACDLSRLLYVSAGAFGMLIMCLFRS